MMKTEATGNSRNRLKMCLSDDFRLFCLTFVPFSKG
jgi:hypothetical protein